MAEILMRLPEIYENAVEIYESALAGEVHQFEETERIGDGRNSLAFGDNLSYMRHLLDSGYRGKINMIYVDPPFFSKTDYSINIRVGTSKRKLILAKNPAFTDKWNDGRAEYLTQLAARLMLMRDLLSDTGSIFVHLDWHSTHYIKIIMDMIFGEKNFVNEIIWNYKSGGVSNRYFARKHDNILFYSKSSDYFFKAQKEKSYNRGFKPYRFKGVKEYKDDIGWYTLVNMKDVWQIDMVGRTSSERTGYATQKPENLIERLLMSVTEQGDLCADFFCGSGTLGSVCSKLGRDYILCDNGAPAIMTSHKRLATLNSSHKTVCEKIEISDNLKADIEVEEIEGIFDSVSVSIKGIHYEDYNAIGVTSDNESLLETIVENHYDQLVEYWCVDTNYDGAVMRPDIYCCREKDKIDLAVTIPTSMIKRVAVKVMDVFGNVYLTEL